MYDGRQGGPTVEPGAEPISAPRPFEHDAPPVLDAPSRWPFYLTLTYLLLEFSRPQELVPLIGQVRLPAIVTLLLGLALVASGRLRLEPTQTRLFVAFLLIMVPHVPVATNNFWAYHVLRSMAITFIAYLGIITSVRSHDRFRTLVLVWLGIHVFLAINGIRSGGKGIGGFLGDENDFALTLNMVVPFAFYLSLTERRRGRQLIYLALAGLFVFANVSTESRGGFLGLAAVAFACWARSSRRLASAVVLGVLAVFILQAAPDSYWDEIRTIQRGTKDSTGEDRIYTWTIGWDMFLDNPVLGVGQGNFPYEFRRYELAAGFHEGLRGRSRAGRAAHSLYFTLLPELGLLGTVIYGSMVVLCFRDLRWIARVTRNVDSEEARRAFAMARAIEASLVGFFVSGAFISVLYYPNFWVLMAFLVALRRIVTASMGHDQPT